MASKAEVNKLSYIQEYCIYMISASGSRRPCPCEPQTQLLTLKTERYTHTVTQLKLKQTVHLYYWFRVTIVFYMTLMALFQRVSVILCPENVLKLFSCPEKNYCAQVNRSFGFTFAFGADVVSFSVQRHRHKSVSVTAETARGFGCLLTETCHMSKS